LNQETEQIETIRQYLLGRLPEEELEVVDKRLVTDPAFYEELLMVEDELIDDYIAQDLSSEERQSFENHFLMTPERQKKLRFSRAFFNRMKVPAVIEVEESVPSTAKEDTEDVPHPPPEQISQEAPVREAVSPLPAPNSRWYERYFRIQSPIIAYSAIAAALLIVAAVSWVVLRNRTPQLSGPVYAVTITAGATRGPGDDRNRFSIPPGIGTVELKAELRQSDHAKYNAAVLDANGSELWRQTDLQARNEVGARVVVVPVPARLLLPGDYSLKLTGVTPDGNLEDLQSYRFHVTT